jgi:hypothetical protein
MLQQDNCAEITKLAEGGFNKVFLLRAKNGREEIARIPTPIAGPPHCTTASEVATMDFLRNVLKLPVPKSLGYSAIADNPVGAEYILMERVEGQSLASRWLSLTTDDVKHIMSQIAEIERNIFDFQFPAMGAYLISTTLTGKYIYLSWARTILSSALRLPASFGMASKAEWRLTVGLVCPPIFHILLWVIRRLISDVGLLPVECITSAARREMAVIQQHAKPQPRQTFLLPANYDIHPSEHVSLLSQFLELSPHLVPPGPSSFPTSDTPI